jgi:DNA-directed RNA polymerase subunit M/transcription elongation factor TFIIS
MPLRCEPCDTMLGTITDRGRTFAACPRCGAAAPIEQIQSEGAKLPLRLSIERRDELANEMARRD